MLAVAVGKTASDSFCILSLLSARLEFRLLFNSAARVSPHKMQSTCPTLQRRTLTKGARVVCTHDEQHAVVVVVVLAAASFSEGILPSRVVRRI